MNTAIYQLALIIGMGTLAILLMRGMSLLTALYRSALVLGIMLAILVVSGIVISWATTRRPETRDIDEASDEVAEVEEPK
ncbi:MAG: hypothetical protein KAU50_09500 [Candidatus Marinimicrobia bacterium]|nr:hypothetical protein [Candidatus Neomarinimicrobiota bacterium]